uniref:Heparan sulfate 2-O-sulfotransferase 1 n=1 Tax=Petromyzon marinus TaxID=7757 RepID=A0AAJ7U3K9_PETMA|nr:heparan sulfate 2-O-sulfotransferase 1-like [Petromyzon marinus]XP_032829075.1 heparan sulfate 2-O-sulfotransferase 1-like [Petromyzon marinus]
MPGRFGLLAALLLVGAMLFVEHQIRKLEQARAKLERVIARREAQSSESQLAAEHRQLQQPQRLLLPPTQPEAALAAAAAAASAPAQPPADDNNDVVIVYNRVPKTGSTSFTNVAYDLCGRNSFHVLHINTTRNSPIMSLHDQAKFVSNVTTWKEMKPGFYHGHLSFIDFTKFGVNRKPIYINVVRDPIERLISYYYFLRFGDDYRPGLRRRKQGDKKTFDECVREGGSDCSAEKLWLQIPFFCGHSSECWNPGNRWALEQAKTNLLSEYLLVGVTEELEDFIMLLEAALPRFFKGATSHYRSGKRSHLRRTVEKKPPSRESIQRLQQSRAWQMEKEFYEFVLEQFQFVRAHAVLERGGELFPLAQNYFYEKIYPRHREFHGDRRKAAVLQQQQQQPLPPLP